ncbi:MAG: hypothetical protein V4475_07460 [Pseudomonadota bacterium]
MDEEPGFTPDEIERGEDRAWHIPPWGCLAVLALLVAAAIILWRDIATSTDL